ncbi:Cytochrome P450 family protein [Marssonina coronariae]|uniref:Cytochrome P450 family protein n=1 Tax=Diplocarpon coronariae TaxID=2795749 RepID=A0A218ZBK7_9HELO|nr:Cytochrome P450 family protein [Marssonina coronariae]
MPLHAPEAQPRPGALLGQDHPDALRAKLAVALLCGLVVSAVSIAMGRLYLSPLAAFPGPRLAALSNWYEFYYDVVLQGQFTWKIQQLHKQYGPIIRITPTELHIDDPDYYDTLYSRGGKRHKYAYLSGRFGHASDTFSTVDHDLHRQRRKALSPMFSGQKIDDFQPVIREKVEKFCQKVGRYRDGQVLPLSRALMALTTDIITEYAFARSYDQLDSPGFQDTLHEALVAVYTVGQFALHFPFVFPILDLLPPWLVRRAHPEILPVVGMRKEMAEQVREIRDGLNEAPKHVSHPTIFHELLFSDLPPEETSDARLGDEAQLIIAAGLVTTSWALAVSSFHISKRPAILHRLRRELADAGSTPTTPLDWHKLEQLPYLRGCVHEGVRLAHGIATRDPRRAPDAALQYGDWTIPPNTAVSMTNVDVLTNAAIFPRPHDFLPERWIGKPELERYFVPFGRGSRACAGVNLAQAELYITLAVVFTRFTFELYETDLSDVQMAHAYLVPYPKWDSKGVRVVVTER